MQECGKAYQHILHISSMKTLLMSFVFHTLRHKALKACLGGNNCSRAFMTSFKSLWKNFCPLFISELICFSHIGEFSSMNGLFKVIPQRLIWIYFQTTTESFENLHSVFFSFFFFLSHSEVDWLVCFGSLSCCRT